MVVAFFGHKNILPDVLGEDIKTKLITVLPQTAL